MSEARWAHSRFLNSVFVHWLIPFYENRIFPYDLHKYAMDTMCFASRLAEKKAATYRHERIERKLNETAKSSRCSYLPNKIFGASFIWHDTRTQFYCIHVCSLWSIRARDSLKHDLRIFRRWDIELVWSEPLIFSKIIIAFLTQNSI